MASPRKQKNAISRHHKRAAKKRAKKQSRLDKQNRKGAKSA